VEEFCRRPNTGFQFAVAGLLVGVISTLANQGLADAPNLRAGDKTSTPLSSTQVKSEFLEEGLKAILSDFGVPVQHIPNDFEVKVRRWVRVYQTQGRHEIERILGPRRCDFELVRQQVSSADLPPDLAFLTLVESHFQAGQMSPDDNAGLWQFNKDTARRNGLKVNAQVDERLDPYKSTKAACRYFLRLKRELGQESSLMLILAAYNMGPGRLVQRTSRMEDPSKRRDFWLLYQTRVLPALTRNHLARLMAAILIGRDPQSFGFKAAAHSDKGTTTSA
jgi:peptidoglycan lytic transglycosylase D